MGECLNGSWFDYGTQNPPGGGEIIPAGSQSFTANGTFTVPYTGVYTVVLTAPCAKGGNGGYGSSDERGGGGGGAGGSAYIADTPLLALILLEQGESVPITVNTSVSSFGSFLSFSAGSGGGNGTSGKSDGFGSGGSAGSKPTWSVANNPKILFSVSPTIVTRNLSGGNGYNYVSQWEEDFDGYDYGGYLGGSGGKPSIQKGNPGGSGGHGNSFFSADQAGRMTFSSPDRSGSTGSAAQSGSIQIIWGTSKGG